VRVRTALSPRRSDAYISAKYSSPVRLGTRYHDGKPDEPGKDWWGTVTGFQPPGSLDFHHAISVSQLRATIDVRTIAAVKRHAEGGGGR
jgi:hypothetical protein